MTKQWNTSPYITKTTDDISVLSRLGFRCLEPVTFLLEDGSFVLVRADEWNLQDKILTGDRTWDSALRIYKVYFEGGTVEKLDEIDVVGLVGEAFLDL